MCVTLVFNTKGQRHLRVGLAVPLFGSLSSLRALVAVEGNISPDQVLTQCAECTEEVDYTDHDHVALRPLESSQ